ncbi:MAG: helix-turn-helix transcriptional regulator [Nitrosomonas sp.]|nr:helix-turn-helix transcriptional regulator [Nitrosomonas sp.]
MSEEPWMTLLRRQVEAYNAQFRNGKGGIKKAAEQLGVSRSTISLILSGQYIASSEHVAKKVLEVFARVQCPHLGQDISNQQCRENSSREAPTSSPRAMKHWRACQSCAHNQNKGTDHDNQ